MSRRRRSDRDRDRERKEAELARSSRFDQRSDGWYFQTREGIAVGPYPSAFDAELSASLLVARLAQLGADDHPASAILAFIQDPLVGPNRPTLSANVDLAELRAQHRQRQRRERWENARTRLLSRLRAARHRA